MSASSQPPDHITQDQAEQHTARILQLAEAGDTAGLVAYLNRYVLQEKWDAMVFLYSKSRELQVTIFRGEVALAGQYRLPARATVAELATAPLA